MTYRVAPLCGCVTRSRIRRGLCGSHYNAERNFSIRKPRKTIADHFWKRVDKRGTDDCWRWTGSHTSGGYGKFGYKDAGKSRTIMAHRFAYEAVVGPIPDGLQLDHVKARGCVHRDCVNPAHLEPVTARENLLRSPTWAGLNAAKTTCPQGHPYDVEVLNAEGGVRQRACSTCNRAAVARFRRRKRASQADEQIERAS